MSKSKFFLDPVEEFARKNAVSNREAKRAMGLKHRRKPEPQAQQGDRMHIIPPTESPQMTGEQY